MRDHQTDNVSGEQVVYAYDALNRLASAAATHSAKRPRLKPAIRLKKRRHGRSGDAISRRPVSEMLAMDFLVTQRTRSMRRMPASMVASS